MSEQKILGMLGSIYRNATALSDFLLDHKQIVLSPIRLDTRFFSQSDSSIRGFTICVSGKPCRCLVVKLLQISDDTEKINATNKHYQAWGGT